jgi:putative ABC transport system permease protein
MLKFLPLLWAALQRHRLRTAFTLGSVMVAFLLFGVLSAVRSGFSAGVEVAGADRLMTTHKASFTFALPYSYWARIRSVPGIREVTHATWFGGYFQEESNFLQMFPVDPETYLSVYTDYVVKPEDKARWLGDRTGALIGRAYADRFGWKVGDRVPLRSNIYRRTDGGDTWEFTIDGFFDGAQAGIDTQQVLIHYDFFEESLQAMPGGGKGYVGWYIVKVESAAASAQIAAAVDSLFANSSSETKTSTEKAFVQAFVNQMGSIGTILTAVASAVFFTMLLVTANTMAQSVRERSAELGVLKTLGFRDTTVLWLVLGEAMAITVLGGALGLGLAALMVGFIGTMLSQFVASFFLTGSSIAVGILLMVVLGLVSGALPATQALRLKIVDALRRE